MDPPFRVFFRHYTAYQTHFSEKKIGTFFLQSFRSLCVYSVKENRFSSLKFSSLFEKSARLLQWIVFFSLTTAHPVCTTS